MSSILNSITPDPNLKDIILGFGFKLGAADNTLEIFNRNFFLSSGEPAGNIMISYYPLRGYGDIDIFFSFPRNSSGIENRVKWDEDSCKDIYSLQDLEEYFEDNIYKRGYQL